MKTTSSDSGPAGWLATRRAVRAAEKALERGAPERAAALLAPIARRRPGDLHVQTLIARAATEEERWDDARLAASRVLSLSGCADGGWVLEGEVCIARGWFEEAREPLRRASDGNIVAPALIAILDLFEPAKGAAPAASLSMAPAAVWFAPVLAHLVFFLERKLEAEPRTEKLHQVRAALFRPDFRPEVFQPARPGPLSRLLGRLRSARRRERERRELEVYDHIERGDLGAAAASLEGWLASEPGDPPAANGADPRRDFLFEVLFAGGRFEEIAAGLPALDKIPERDPHFQLLAAYSLLACGQRQKAERVLAGWSGPPEISAAAAHLRALAAIQSGSPARAIAWLRRAVGRDEMGLVDLARGELEFLSIQPPWPAP